jgi:YbbR domain-containing protein
MNALNKREFSLSLQYPIEFKYDQEEFIAVQPLPKNIKVNVTGNGWSLLQKSWLSFRAHPVSYTINNPTTTSVLNSSALIDEIVESLPGLKVNHVMADTFELGFEKKRSKVMHIRVDSAAIDLREGYVISSFVNVSPSLIMLEGAASEVATYPDTLWVRVPDTKIQNNYDESISLPLSLKPHVQASHTETFISFEVARYLLEDR